MKLANRLWTMTWSIISAIVLYSCTPDSPDYISDYDIVYTNNDKSFDFTPIQTYFMPDSVVHIVESGTTANHTFDAQILSTLKSNLDQLGWTRVAENGSSRADVIVLPTASRTAYASCASYCWYCYWGWYPGWGYYPPGWGAGWGWGYPSDIVCTSYNTGTVFVSITDPMHASVADSTLPVRWVGIMNGLLEGTDADVNNRITKSINQMFIQSPYLK
jgi:hypothetical protein